MTAKGRPIDEVVSWSVDSTPAWVRAAGAGQFLFRAVLEMGSGAGAGPVERPDALTRRRLPSTQTEPINLSPAFVEGEADWLPPAWAGKQLVTCGWNAVTINPKGFEGSEVQVPLSHVEDRVDMWVGLRSLPARQRTVMVLRYYEDLTEAATAEAMACSIGTVKRYHARALSALRRTFEPEGAHQLGKVAK